jgi:hypothetical protein
MMVVGLMMSGCVSVWTESTRVEPLPLKVGILRDNEVDIGVPLVVEEKVTGGWRSPVEMRIRILLTSPADIPLPLEPNGVVGGVRVRW